MKCPECQSSAILFQGIWYVLQGDYHVLMNHYGCQNCRVAFRRPVDESVYYYVREGDRTIFTRQTHTPAKHERRLPIVNMAPGMLI